MNNIPRLQPSKKLKVFIPDFLRHPKSWSLQCNTDSEEAFYYFIIQNSWLSQKQTKLILI